MRGYVGEMKSEEEVKGGGVKEDGRGRGVRDKGVGRRDEE